MSDGTESTQEAAQQSTQEAAPRRPLSHQLVVSEAVRYIDDHGLSALTMRRLGQSLGVEAMSLYRYVDGREALLDGVVDHVTSALAIEPERPLLPSDGWQAFLLDVAKQVRGIALDHPRVFPLVATRNPSAPWLRPPLRSLDLVESFLQGLLRRGFDDDSAVAAYRAFSSFLLGHLLLEVSAHGAETAPAEEPLAETDHRSTGETQDELADFPNLRRLRVELAADHAAAEFEESLENLLDRLERFVV